ncbi:hypothetical protein ACFX2I_035918 [Malus domestica]
MDEFKLLAERSMDSCFGLGTFMKSLKRQRKIAQYILQEAE